MFHSMMIYDGMVEVTVTCHHEIHPSTAQDIEIVLDLFPETQTPIGLMHVLRAQIGSVLLHAFG